MRFASALAIYTLFWAFCLFLVLPFRLRSDAEPDQAVPGQADGAPPRFSVRRTAIWTTILSAALFALYYVNWVNGWVLPEMVDLFSDRR